MPIRGAGGLAFYEPEPQQGLGQAILPYAQLGLQRQQEQQKLQATNKILIDQITQPNIYSLKTRTDAYRKFQELNPTVPQMTDAQIAANEGEIVKLGKRYKNILGALDDPKNPMDINAAQREISEINSTLEQLSGLTIGTEEAEKRIAVARGRKEAKRLGQAQETIAGGGAFGPSTPLQQALGTAAEITGKVQDVKVQDVPEELTLTQSDSQLLQYAYRVGIDNLNPAQRARFIKLTATSKGMSLKVNPDGTVEFAQGGVFDKPTPAFKTQAQKELVGIRKSLDSLNEIQKAFKPELFGYGGAVRGGVSRFIDNISEKLLPETGVFSKGFLNDEVSAKRRAEESFNIYKKNITGVQFSVKELEFLKRAWPVPSDSPTVFIAKLNDVKDSHVRSVARLLRFGYKFTDEGKMINPDSPPDKSQIFGVSLSDITPEEMERTRLLLSGGQGAPGTTQEDLSGLSDEEIMRQLGAQ
jgi:hypothetical protein